MKDFKYLLSFILILTCFCKMASGQEKGIEIPSSKIYFIRSNQFVGSAIPTYVSLPNQNKLHLKLGAVVEYKIYSEGDIQITAECASHSIIYTNLEVKRGKEYFIYLSSQTVFKIEEVQKQVVQKILDKPKEFISKSENLEKPINPASLADIIKKNERKQGTCFLLSSEGYFITNYHCVENADKIFIRGIDGDFTTKYGVQIIASDPSNDLALVKILNKNAKFTSPPFAIRTTGISQAEKVYALGFPQAESLGDQLKITEGIISPKSGMHGDISKFQISAAVNPGNSGGPLIDEEGNLIGIIYAKSSISDAAGYAIKAGYLETFLKNIDNFAYPVFTSLIKDKPLPQKVSTLKDFIFIIETE